MKKTKKVSVRKNQLDDHTTLFLQLGILLALVLVYSIFELSFEKQVIDLPENAVFNEEAAVFVFPAFAIENSKEHKEKVQPKKTELLPEFTLAKKEETPASTTLLLNKSEKPIDFDALFADVPPIEDPSTDEAVPFVRVEQAPRYPGCTGNSEKEYKNCFNQKIKKFIAKNFNPQVAPHLIGKQRILVQFEIDKNGNITHIKARAPHKNLEKEAMQVVKKLPKMEPGKQRTRSVGVSYALPITIHFK